MTFNYSDTQFASAERTSQPEIIEQSRHFLKNKLLVDFANSISQMLVILNENRQIIFANDFFCRFLGIEDVNPLLGKRPGESVNCVHAVRGNCGCGTTRFCRYCGAVNSILAAQKGKQSTEECRIITADNTAFELRVTSSPLKMENQHLTVFVVEDISNEKKVEKLERFFFKNILYHSEIISSLSDILKELKDKDDFITTVDVLQFTVDELIEEIKVEQKLLKAELGKLEVKEHEGKSMDLLKKIRFHYSMHDLASNKKIIIDEGAEDVPFISDITLLKQVIGEMVVNALEYSQPKETVTISSKKINNAIRFSAHNQGFIKEETQLQLFQRSFTTEEKGRGSGTYIMKLFGERYLNGKVSFESSKQKGTTFCIDIPIDL